MSKIVRRVISASLIAAAFITLEPSKYINLATEKAYASSHDDDDDDDDHAYLDELSVSDHDFAFSDTKYSYNIEVSEDTNEIRVKAEPEDEDDTVEIAGKEVDDSDNYRRWVSLDKGRNVIKVRVDDDDSDNDRTYTLNVYRGEKAPSEDVAVGQEDNTQDSIYLDKLKFVESKYSLNFRRKVTKYEVNVPESCDNLIIKAEPDENGDKVKVDNGDVDSNYNRRVYLKEGKNVIEVSVCNNEARNDGDFEERTYTITINRGMASSTTTTDTSSTNNNVSNTSNNTVTSTANQGVKINQWVQVNGLWQFNDSLGHPLKNAWAQSNGKWYHLGADGIMQTNCWIYDANYGKYYYVYPDGSMAVNTWIGGCRVGTDGAWTI